MCFCTLVGSQIIIKTKELRLHALYNLLKGDEVRKWRLTILGVDGDKSLCGQVRSQQQHMLARMEFYRIFKLPGAVGFLPDMSKLVYFSRDQRQNNRFASAAAIGTSYRAQQLSSSNIR